MSWLPEWWSRGGGRSDPPRRRILPIALAGGAVAAAGGVVWAFSDRIAARVYEHWRPRLERQVGMVMGRPLRLGPYRGLSADGLVVGPSRFLAGPADGSTVAAREVRVAFDPLQSWLRRTALLDLSFRGAEADLRPNARGQVWVLGSLPPGREPPRLDLRFRLLDPGRVRLWGVSRDRKPLLADVSADVGLRTHRRQLDLSGVARLPGQPGVLQLQGAGNWQQRRWVVDLRPAGLDVQTLQRLLPLPAGSLAGRAEGRLRLQLDQGTPSCSGDLRVRQLRWQARGSASPVTMAALPLACRGTELIAGPAPWRYGGWSGRAQGRIAADRRLQAALQATPPGRDPLSRLPIQAWLQGRLQGGALAISGLQLRRGRGSLEASGRFGSQLALQGSWRLDPTELPGAERRPPWLGRRWLAGDLRLDGPLRQPALAVRTGQPSHPLLGPWQAALRWQAGSLRLERFSGQHLQASGSLPLRLARGIETGPLQLQLALGGFPLARLEPVLGTSLQGRISATGSLRGPLAGPVADLQLQVVQPVVGPLRLSEVWQGRLQASGGLGGSLDLRAEAPAEPGRLRARLDRRWLPTSALLERAGGSLWLGGTPAAYRWQARSLPLEGLALAMGPRQTFQPLRGDLSGVGTLQLQPFAFSGRVSVAEPLVLGLAGRSLQADVRYGDRRYNLEARLEPLAGGQLTTKLDGRWSGPFQARLEGRSLDGLLLRDLRRAWALWRGGPPALRGQAADLGSLAIDTLGASVDSQLRALAAAIDGLAARNQELAAAGRAERLARLRGRFDTDAVLRGPDLERARLDLKASGHVWFSHADRDQALASEPVRLELQGPLSGGEGSFSLAGLPLALLGLLAPLPPGLSGGLAASGRYRLGGGGAPTVGLDLTLVDGRLRERPLLLDRGRLELRGASLAMDLALRARGAADSITLAGTIPLESQRQGLELRLVSRGDALHFLTELLGDALVWRRGSTDLRLLVRGSLADPIANGFLSVRGGRARFIGQDVRDIQATVLFDFQQLLVQELTARVGGSGRISGSGRLDLVRPRGDDPSLAVSLRQVPFVVPRVTAVADGRLTFGGSLLAPQLGGDLTIARGTVNVQPGELARGSEAPKSQQPVQPTAMKELLESGWDFREPLLLLGPEVASSSAEQLAQTVPNVPWLTFQGLRLRFGPDLRAVVPNVAQFSTGGQLRLSGRLDPSLRASGVVRLLGGRLNLFTTSFSLDPDAPNVAVFTPSLGLVPYLDIALRTRIADSLNVLRPSGVDGTSGGSDLAQIESVGGLSSLNQLKLILVTVAVSGPADRIADSIQLRSSPPLPQERLVALIGGNSLAGLSGGGAGTALATVLGQSLLSPLLASLTDLFGQRVSLALYPAYVTQAPSSSREVRSGRVPPQLVLATEVGYDLSDRVSATVLAAPNRSDVPPQLTLNVKATETLNLQGSIDTQGVWQTLLQVFFRF